MGRISLRIPDALEQSVRDLIPLSEYPNMSELIRDLLRDWTANKRMTTKVKPE